MSEVTNGPEVQKVSKRFQPLVELERKKIEKEHPGIDPYALNQYARDRVAGGKIREKLQREARFAFNDELTGLPNRVTFEENFKEIVAQYNRVKVGGANPPKVYLLTLDLDNLHYINDDFAHEGGDAALRLIGGLHTRPGEKLYRWGGDEFAMFIRRDINGNDPTEEEVIKTAKRLQSNYATLARGYFRHKPAKNTPKDRPVHRSPTVTMGIAQYREETDIEAFHGRADARTVSKDITGRNAIFIERGDPRTDSSYYQKVN